MLAAIWWRRKGIVVPLFLSLVLILSHLFLRQYYVDPLNDYFRALIMVAVFSVVCFLSERTRRETAKTQHLNLTLRSIRDINQLVTREKEIGKFIRDACNKLVEDRSYNHAWIALFDDDGKLGETAEAGLGSDFSSIINHLLHGTLNTCDSSITWQQKLKIIMNPIVICHGCPLAHKYKGNGAMVYRFTFNDKSYGLLSVSAPVEVICEQEEQTLFQELCEDIAFGLHNLIREEKRGKMESELIQSEQKFRQLAEQSPNIIFIYKKGKVVYLNTRHEEITGYTKESSYAPGFNYVNTMVVPEHRELLQKYFLQHGKRIDISPIEYTFMTKDSRRIDAILNTQLIQYEGEKALLGVITDITALKKTEKALRESESRFKETVELLPQAVFECDINGNVTFANNKALEMFGYTEEDLAAGHNVMQIIATEDHARFNDNVRRVLSGKIVYGEEFTAVRKDGSTFPMTGYSSAIMHDNRPAGIRGTVIDLTTSKQMEEELKLKAQMLDMANDAILAYDFKGNIIYANEITSTFTGYSLNELLAMNLRKLMLPQRQNDFDKLINTLEEKKRIHFEFSGINSDGSMIPLDVSSQIIESGGRKLAMSIAHDITERKNIENILMNLNTELERRIETRTRELLEAQDQLLRQEKLVLLGQLAGGVSHELRNPLGVIKNTTYFLNMILDKSDPEVNEALNILDKEVINSEQIIKSLLEFAHPGPLTREIIDINSVLHDTIRNITVPDTIEIVYNLNKKLPLIQADPNKLDQIFRNIIVNAIQAMPDKGKLTIKTESQDQNWILVSITDTGTGISEENLSNIFEPLFTTKAKGIGLGLAYIKILIEEHKGAITVQSQIGHGSTFTIRLPLNSVEKE